MSSLLRWPVKDCWMCSSSFLKIVAMSNRKWEFLARMYRHLKGRPCLASKTQHWKPKLIAVWSKRNLKRYSLSSLFIPSIRVVVMVLVSHTSWWSSINLHCLFMNNAFCPMAGWVRTMGWRFSTASLRNTTPLALADSACLLPEYKAFSTWRHCFIAGERRRYTSTWLEKILSPP